MRRVTVLVTSAAFVLLSFVLVNAQGRPDFSGQWTLDPASAPAPAGGAGAAGGGGRGGRGGGAGFGQAFTATQNANTLTITRMQGDQTVTATYKLDGSESTNTVAGRGGAQEQVSKAAWDGNKLAITTTVNFGGNSIEQKRVLSIEDGNLVVEQTNPGRDGGAPTTVRVVYKKG